MPIPEYYHHQALRKESSDEQGLIGQRIGWLLACEGFLVTGYCITTGPEHLQFWWFPAILIPAFGVAAAAFLRAPIETACKTIEFWRTKEDEFYLKNNDFQPLNLAERGEDLHYRSMWFPMWFPMWLPKFFVAFWLVTAAATFVQIWWGVIPVPKS